MSNVLHRVTKEYRLSVNTPDYPVLDWIRNPDLSAVVGFDPKYWLIVGDRVTLMTPAERAAVDAAEAALRADTTADALVSPSSLEKAFAEVLLDELNLHAARITAILDASDAAATLTQFKTAVALIANAPQRTLTQLRDAVRAKL